MEINEKALHIIETLDKAGFKSWVVGGAIRNSLMGLPPKDWDICSTATADEVERAFHHTIPMGKAFGIVTVMIDGEGFEVATLRKESGTSDSRHPETIEFVKDITLDLSRRDLTINSIAFNPLCNELVDPFNGQSDIEAKVINFVGNPVDRIAEDHLRILRAFRFAAQLGFTFSAATWAALQSTGPDTLAGVSEERIGEELNKILLSPNAAQTLDLMVQAGILQLIIPEVQAVIDCQHDSDWHVESWKGQGATVWSHTLFVVEHATALKSRLPKERQLALMWAALLHDIAKPDCKVFRGEAA